MKRLKITGKTIKGIRRPTREEMEFVMEPYTLDDAESRNIMVIELADGTLIWPSNVVGDEPGSFIVSNDESHKLIEP